MVNCFPRSAEIHVQLMQEQQKRQQVRNNDIQMMMMGLLDKMMLIKRSHSFH